MSRWTTYRLEELYTVHNGLSKGRQFFGSGFPFLSFSDVFNNWFLPEQLTSLVQSTESEQESFSIKRGDVFITRTSETMDELGMSSVALKDYPYATYNGFTKRLRPIGDIVLPEYIGFYLRSQKFRSKFMSFSAMITRASLSNEDLLEMEVEIPDMDLQHRISDTLSRYGLLAENYKRQIRLLEESTRRLYNHCFSSETDGYELWDRYKLVDIFDFKYGKILPTTEFVPNGPIPVYGASKRIGFYTKGNCFEPKVLIGSRGNAGFVHRTYESISYVTNNSFIVSPKSSFDYIKLPYIYEAFKAMDFAAVCTGAAQPQLTLGSLASVDFVLPPRELIESFVHKTAPFFERINEAYRQIGLLLESRDRLLPKILSNEVVIK